MENGEIKRILCTFAVEACVGRRRGHLQSQSVGSLEGVAVPDQESSWLSLLQSSDGYSQTTKCFKLILCFKNFESFKQQWWFSW